MPCPHFEVSIVKRSDGKSAVASAAYQSGMNLFSEYQQKWKRYADKPGVLHAEIMLPENAPPVDSASWAASVAVGKNCGVAPGASLYYIAVDQRKNHTEQYAAAILRLLEISKQLPKEQKIKAIAICEYVTFEAACDEFEEAIRQAMAAGIYVITHWNEVTNMIYLIPYSLSQFGPVEVTRPDPLSDPEDPESYSPYHPGFESNYVYLQLHQLFFPLGARTFASADGGYAFFQSGVEFMDPAYLAGLYAIAAQIYAVEELPKEAHSLTPRYFYEVIDHTAEILIREVPDYGGYMTKSSNYMLNARGMVDALWQEVRGSDTTWRPSLSAAQTSPPEGETRWAECLIANKIILQTLPF